jgi:HK97 family phage major capsid protein
MKSISDVQKAQGIALAKAITEGGASGSGRGNAAKEIGEKKEDLKGLLNGSQSEVEIKALTNRAAVINNEQAFDLPDIGQLATGKLTALDIFPRVNVSGSNNNGTIRYYDWDAATTVRAAAMVAEGGTFQQSTAKWEKFSLDLKKIGDTLPVTEEFFEDEAMFAAELERFLMLNVNIEANAQVVNGDGTGENLTGIVTSAIEYVAVSAGISDASIYDLIVKMKESISIGQDAKYNADFVMMNLVDINLMKLKKDANDNYIMPPFVDRNGNVVDGITIVEENTIVANTMVMGDSRFATIYEKDGVQVTRGLVQDQFIEDAVTLKVRKRMLFLIRNVDKTGFRKETSISAALVTLAT